MKKIRKKKEDKQFPKMTKHLYHHVRKKVSKFSWVVSCMAKVELQFDVALVLSLQSTSHTIIFLWAIILRYVNPYIEIATAISDNTCI